jgi:transposase-like protein
MSKDSKITRENLHWFLEQPEASQFELFNKFVDVAKLMFNQLTENEVNKKAGEKYSREKPEEGKYSRWGYNPGSIRIGEEKVKVDVPRMRDNQEHRTISPDSYHELSSLAIPTDTLLKRIILGLSQKDYKEVTQMALESFGLSQSSVSKAFIEESSKVLKEFEERDLGNYDFLCLVIDGKYLSKEQIVIAMGITSRGDKIPLGFVETTTENSKAIKGLLKDLIDRNFTFTEGILTIIDGSKGLKKAVNETFGEYALIQRCQWHKRENVVSYLNEEDEEKYRKKLQRAYNEPEYIIAKSKLMEIKNELKDINRSAAKSLEEGLEETLTIHKLGLVEQLGRSLTTTNTIENLNSHLVKYLRKVRYWRTGDMKARWIASALVDIENRMRRINNYQNLHLLSTALKSTLNIEQKKAG